MTIEDGSHRMLNGHRAPILSVAFDPKDIFLVSILAKTVCNEIDVI